MSSAATKAIMDALHGKVAQELIDRIEDGSATAADMSNAIKFLKDNGVEALPDANSKVGELARQFPTFDGDENAPSNTVQ